MSSILILPITDPEPDLTIYQPIRQTRRFKYYKMINNQNPMEEEQITNASDDMLAAFEDAFANMRIRVGGKRKTRRNRRHKRRTRKSRRY